MANKDIVGGLFGMTPQSYQQAQNANEMDIAASFAKMRPEEQISFGAFRAGQQLGKAGMSLLGVQDPQLEALTNIQGILGQFDSTTSAGLKQMYGALMQKAQETNNPAYARMAQETATKYQSTLLNEANVASKTRENKVTPQNQAESAKLASLQAQYPDTVEGRAMAADKFAEWKSEFRQKEAKAGVPAGEQQDKALRDARVKKLIDYEDRASSASQTLQLVQDFNSVLDKAFVGTASGAKLTAGQVANALGVTVTGTSESEQLDQLFAALTVGQAKNLKGALSDKDVKFLKEAVGSRGLTKDTLVAVINRIAREAEVDKGVYNKASSFQGDLAKFDFSKAQDETRKEVNEKIAKQQRLNELRKKQGQTAQ